MINGFSIEKTKSGYYTMLVNNRYIHSKYNPIKEAENFAKSINLNQKTKNLVIYGLGLGYHIEAIKRQVPSRVEIVVFEANNDVIEKCRIYNKDIFNYDNIKVIGYGYDFYDELDYYLNTVEDIIIHKPSLEFIKESNKKLYMLLSNYQISRESIKKSYDVLNDNYESNIKEAHTDIQSFFEMGRKDRPYLIVAGGPSLDLDLDLIKEFKHEFNILTVGTAFNTLMKNGIKPLGVVIIDGKEIVANQLKGNEESDIPLLFLSTASKVAVQNYKGPKYIFFNDFRENKINITTGKTVAVATMDIAIKCGAKELIMIGQDLAFLEGKSHISSFENIYGFKDNLVNEVKKYYVEGINGEKLETTKGYIFFKEQIETLIEKNKKIKFINCSKGAKIDGAIHCSLDEYLKGKI
ncbi:Uncharacterized conserved protein [Clostridium cavendishii DSM 21758]|uniref:Uncharacterized conserved protein n=1 Tax=Clostridium cavendishii DSM 21758 TaxID=1121302 RepID=A0A1M6B1T7_9CLOT|nr:6-hydroxymethylpterin diphosphokinase MptE-like protein [Clostridium cavendishii]SHI42453.1 Uncharacterized conserved protein [Clostridium cavendishii DSM 21758]